MTCISPGIVDDSAGDNTDAKRKRTKRNDGLQESLKKFKDFSGLTNTGINDAAIIKQMGVPRCGSKDVADGSRKRRKRDDKG